MTRDDSISVEAFWTAYCEVCDAESEAYDSEHWARDWADEHARSDLHVELVDES